MMQNNDSNKFSNENNKLLDVVKQYLRIEHQDDDKDLLDCIRGGQVCIRTNDYLIGLLVLRNRPPVQ